MIGCCVLLRIAYHCCNLKSFSSFVLKQLSNVQTNNYGLLAPKLSHVDTIHAVLHSIMTITYLNSIKEAKMSWCSRDGFCN